MELPSKANETTKQIILIPSIFGMQFLHDI